MKILRGKLKRGKEKCGKLHIFLVNTYKLYKHFRGGGGSSIPQRKKSLRGGGDDRDAQYILLYLFKVIILDEAHNIEDSAREAVSGTFNLEDIGITLQECERMKSHGILPEVSSLIQLSLSLGCGACSM